jgi:hypothetical protein
MGSNNIDKLLNEQIRTANAFIREMKHNKSMSKQNEIVETLRLVSESMRKNGASEQSIRTAVQGTYEFLKATLDERLNKSAEKMIKNPESRLQHDTEAPGILLSEVETQQVDWLWQRRIPLGKITLLDGDPGMGKSLLAINIAACVSTGQPMAWRKPSRHISSPSPRHKPVI